MLLTQHMANIYDHLSTSAGWTGNSHPLENTVLKCDRRHKSQAFACMTHNTLVMVTVNQQHVIYLSGQQNGFVIL